VCVCVCVDIRVGGQWRGVNRGGGATGATGGCRAQGAGKWVTKLNILNETI